MRKALLLVCLFTLSILNGQSSWKKIDSKNHRPESKPVSHNNTPAKYDLYRLDMVNFKNELTLRSDTGKTIQLPNIKGSFSRFIIKETSNFTKPLAKKYGFIKSFNIIGVDDKTANGKISIGTNGLYISLYSGKHSSFYIDTYSKEKSTFIAYQRKNIPSKKIEHGCLVKETKHVKEIRKTTRKRGTNDSQLRTYRLALACTGEYAKFHLDNLGVSLSASTNVKKAAVLSAMNTTITRVNAVYERDLAVKMNIVIDNNGENPLIFLDENTDNLTNDNANVLIVESQTICDNIIGDDNYDIGHTFSTSAGGLASIDVVCLTGAKGQGVTGVATPISDSYDIDFVAHELGHQFGAMHTFNGEGGYCDNISRSTNNAVEPGSGSTIMGYTGICGLQDIQDNSDDYFHAVSIASMSAVIQNTSCATATNTQNTAPVVNAGVNVSVPKLTPLILRGTANDNESNESLTYCWEQIDKENSYQPPVPSNLGGPAFRSLPPTSSKNRYLPSLNTVLNGNTSSKWEVIPDVARTLNFSLTVRDNYSGGGATGRDDIEITVLDINPFIVTSQNTTTTWQGGGLQTITWAKSSTDQAPINCSHVKIKLSLDGGNTFPIILTESTPNIGSYKFTVPNTPTDKARILVEAVDNIFYNINGKNFTIKPAAPNYSIINKTNSLTICNNAINEVVYFFDLNTINNFSEDVVFSLSTIPNNITSSFSVQSMNSDGSLAVTLSNLKEVANGTYNMTLNAISGSIKKTTEFVLSVNNDLCNSHGNTDNQISTTSVIFADINKKSTKENTGYSNYKDTFTEIVRGENYELITKGNADGYNNVETYAWIDWNQNCQFENNEFFNLGNVVDSSSENKKFFNVPKDAVLGNTTLRVITAKDLNTNENSCSLNLQGETEDYAVIVKESFASLDTLFEDLSISPIPSNGKIKINFKVVNKNTAIKIFDLKGRLVFNQNFVIDSSSFSQEIILNNLRSAMYFIRIENAGKKITKKIIIL